MLTCAYVIRRFPLLPALASIVPAPLSDCRTRHGFRRATPEVTDPGPRAVHEQGLLAAEHSVGPQTGQCPDPGSTIADFERLVIDEPATEECKP